MIVVHIDISKEVYLMIQGDKKNIHGKLESNNQVLFRWAKKGTKQK